MSFVRLGKSHAPSMQRKKKAAPKKPKPWDDTVHDLTAYKATPDEIAYRINSHKSKHAVGMRLGRPGVPVHKGKKSSPFRNNSQARKLAIMKEVLYDQHQLQDVLEKSDTMMAVVKDLFGDDPRRFAGFPAVTTAPDAEKRDVSHSLVTQHPSRQTRSEILSDSIVDSSALNDLQTSESEGEQDYPAAPVSYQPKMNMQRFQQFLESEERNNTLSTISGQAGMSHLVMGGTQGPVQSSQLPDQTTQYSQDGTFQTPQKGLDESLEILRPPKSAMNDTNKVKKTRSRVAPPPQQTHNTSSLSVTDLRKVLENLEEEIAEYERQTGRRHPAERQRQETFSGYTQAIVDAVTKVTRYLKECELRLMAEMTVREQLAQDVVQFRNLVDALTSDIILTQEEFAGMASEFKKFKQDTKEEIAKLKGVPVDVSAPPSVSTDSPGQMVTPPRHQPPLTGADLEIPQQLPQQLPQQQRSHFGEHLQPLNSAVLLSPPVRRNRMDEPERDTDKQGSPLDLPGYVSSNDSSMSAFRDEYAALPGTTQSQQPCPVSYSGASMPLPGYIGVRGQEFRETTEPYPVSVPQPQSHTVTAGQPRQAYREPISHSSVSQPHAPVPMPRNTSTAYREPVSQASLPQPHAQVPVPRNISTASAGNRLHSQPGVSSQPPRQAQSKPPSYMAPLNTVSVPRPTPLVQSNVGIPVQQAFTDYKTQPQTQLQPQSQSQRSEPQELLSYNVPHDAAEIAAMIPSADRELLASQIAELNKQHEEAQRRLQGLLIQKQNMASRQPPQQLGQDIELLRQMAHQQPIPSEGNPQNTRVPVHRVETAGSQSSGQMTTRSTELPGHQPQYRQTGLPEHPVSPNISPISERSENFRMMFQSVESQDSSMTVPASRGITVSIPKMQMDSPSPGKPETVR